MFDPYLAGMVWRLEHQTEADRRDRDARCGQVVAALRSLRARAGAAGRSRAVSIGAAQRDGSGPDRPRDRGRRAYQARSY
jgi:hypothetical protein